MHKGGGMSVFGKSRDKLGRLRTKLTSLDDMPLGKAALVILIFLDIFILVAIFNGLDAHTRQLSAPDDYIPLSCREIVVDRRWNPTNRIDNLSQIVLSRSESHFRPEEKKIDHHPLCAPYVELLDRIQDDKALTKAFEDRMSLSREARDLQREIENLKGAYDTSLLETIARQEEGRPNVAAIQADIRKKAADLNALQGRITALEQGLNANATVRLLWDRLQNLREQDRERLKEDLRTLNFWFPVKKLAMQMAFLLPLFVVFYVWNTASIRKGRGVQALVSSHLLVVAFIPIFCKIIEMVYDIIPKKLLKKVLELLESLKLVAIWHYLVIALAVAAALFLIYIFQKKLFSREKLIERRISKGQCQQCGRHLPAGARACPFCGFAQFKVCGSCSRPTYVHGRFCRECGELAGD